MKNNKTLNQNNDEDNILYKKLIELATELKSAKTNLPQNYQGSDCLISHDYFDKFSYFSLQYINKDRRSLVNVRDRLKQELESKDLKGTKENRKIKEIALEIVTKNLTRCNIVSYHSEELQEEEKQRGQNSTVVEPELFSGLYKKQLRNYPESELQKLKTETCEWLIKNLKDTNEKEIVPAVDFWINYLKSQAVVDSNYDLVNRFIEIIREIDTIPDQDTKKEKILLFYGGFFDDGEIRLCVGGMAQRLEIYSLKQPLILKQTMAKVISRYSAFIDFGNRVHLGSFAEKYILGRETNDSHANSVIGCGLTLSMLELMVADLLAPAGDIIKSVNDVYKKGLQQLKCTQAELENSPEKQENLQKILLQDPELAIFVANRFATKGEQETFANMIIDANFSNSYREEKMYQATFLSPNQRVENLIRQNWHINPLLSKILASSILISLNNGDIRDGSLTYVRHPSYKKFRKDCIDYARVIDPNNHYIEYNSDNFSLAQQVIVKFIKDNSFPKNLQDRFEKAQALAVTHISDLSNKSNLEEKEKSALECVYSPDSIAGLFQFILYEASAVDGLYNNRSPFSITDISLIVFNFQLLNLLNYDLSIERGPNKLELIDKFNQFIMIAFDKGILTEEQIKENLNSISVSNLAKIVLDDKNINKLIMSGIFIKINREEYISEDILGFTFRLCDNKQSASYSHYLLKIIARSSPDIGQELEDKAKKHIIDLILKNNYQLRPEKIEAMPNPGLKAFTKAVVACKDLAMNYSAKNITAKELGLICFFADSIENSRFISLIAKSSPDISQKLEDKAKKHIVDLILKDNYQLSPEEIEAMPNKILQAFTKAVVACKDYLGSREGFQARLYFNTPSLEGIFKEKLKFITAEDAEILKDKIPNSLNNSKSSSALAIIKSYIKDCRESDIVEEDFCDDVKMLKIPQGEPKRDSIANNAFNRSSILSPKAKIILQKITQPNSIQEEPELIESLNGAVKKATSQKNVANSHSQLGGRVRQQQNYNQSFAPRWR